MEGKMSDCKDCKMFVVLLGGMIGNIDLGKSAHLDTVKEALASERECLLKRLSVDLSKEQLDAIAGSLSHSAQAGYITGRLDGSGATQLAKAIMGV
jgi:hypothetical protein